jgi:hypothetical protein
MPARVEIERLATIGQNLFCQPAGHHLGQGLLLRLGLPGQLGAAVAESGDVVLVGKTLKLFKTDRTSRSQCSKTCFSVI